MKQEEKGELERFVWDMRTKRKRHGRKEVEEAARWKDREGRGAVEEERQG